MRIFARVTSNDKWRVVVHYDDDCETAFPENHPVTVSEIEHYHERLHEKRTS